MPTLVKVDAVVTDPPYGIDYGNGGSFQASHGWGPWREKVEWDKERPSKLAFDLMLSATKTLVVWGGNYFTDYLPPSQCWLIWDKGQRAFSLADCELAWCSLDKAARIISYPRGAALLDVKQHPTQKPIAVMEWCLQRATKEHYMVLDPFMGSGTTGVAAVKLGRRFIGIEISPEYYAIAKARLIQAIEEREMDLFKDHPAETEQGELI